MRTHRIVFPRWIEDVESKRRTLAHFPILPVEVQVFEPGDRILVASHHDAAAVYECEIRKADKVHISELEEADLVKLNTTRETYVKRWDALHPELLFASNPRVWRLEFTWEASMPMPEECLAG